MKKNKYDIRRYESADRAGVLELLRHLFDDGIANVEDEWFDWRFHDNPYTTRVPMTVAERDGRVVGLRTTFPIPLSVNGRQEQALLHGDAVVHPDHRREGVFSRIVEWDHERFRESDAVVAYGTPNEDSLSALVRLDYVRPRERDVVATIPEYYRIQNVSVVLNSLRRRGVLGRTLSRFVASRAMNAEILPRVRRTSDDLTVKRRSGVPAELLASLSDERPANRIRVTRDETFYRWRFSNPRYEYATYTVERNGATLASAIVEKKTEPGADTLVSRVVDVRAVSDRTGRGRTLRGLTHAIERDVDSDLLVTRGIALPQSRLPTFDLRSVASYLYTRSASGSRFLARPLDDDVVEWKLHGVDLSDPSNWRLTWCDSQFA